MICSLLRADALQHRDAADLLEDEHARHARHRDAAEDDDHQADQAQIVLRPVEVSADLVVGRAERARVDELVLEVVRAACWTSGSIWASGTRTSSTRRARLPNVSRPVDSRSAVSMSMRGPRLKSPTRRPGSVAMTPRIVNGTCPMTIASPTVDVERGQQLGPHQHAAILQHRVRVGLAALRASSSRREETPGRSRAVPPSGSAVLRPIGGPHHRRRLDRVGATLCARLGEAVGRSSPAPPASSRGVVEISTSAAISVRASLAEHLADALDDRAERDDRRHADGDADEEEQQPPPRRPRLAQRPCAARTSSGRPPRRRCARRPVRPAARAWHRPSPASSASCVTSTSVGVPRRVDVAQQVHDVPAVGAVEVARRLVGEQDRRVVGQRARQRDALLLAAGELRRIVMRAAGQADLVEQRAGPRRGVGRARDLHRHRDVLERRERRNEVEELEDEADLLAAQLGEACPRRGR